MIGVVTVTYNSDEVLDDFLTSLMSQSAEFQLFVVDNASSDATMDKLCGVIDARIELLPQSENLGIAVGNNIGTAAALSAGCDYVLLLNNDTVFEATLFQDLVDRAKAASAHVVVPSLRYFDQPERVWFETARFDRWRGSVPVALDPAPQGTVTTLECACTCCALFDRSVFERVGMMDEQFFVYWDDTDFFYRCDRAGVTMVLDAGLEVLHKVSTLTGGEDSEFSEFERTKNRVYFIRKHHRGASLVVGLLATLANILKLVARSPHRRKRLVRLMRAFVQGIRIPRR